MGKKRVQDIVRIPLENIESGNSIKQLMSDTIQREHKIKRDTIFQEDMALISQYIEASDFMTDEDMGRAENLIERYYAAAHPSLDNPDSIPFADKVMLFDSLFRPQFGPAENPSFTFIDLFAGIGGFRQAMQSLGGQCVFASEIDSMARATYTHNYCAVPYGDITLNSTKSHIPEQFNILCAGFPCQAFSQAGLRQGFLDETRGTLFFHVADIIEHFEPDAFFLENVKGLLSHDGGHTIEVIMGRLRELNYFVPDPQVVNAMNFGVPQNRERVFIVGFHNRTGVQEFQYPAPTDTSKRFRDVKEEEVVDVKYYLSQRYWQTLVNHKKRHRSAGNGFGYEIIGDDDIANTFLAGAMGREHNLVIDPRQTQILPATKLKGETNEDFVRNLTPKEAAGLQGFPRNFVFPVSDYAAYKQIGNSVAVPAVKETGRCVLEKLGIPIIE